MDELCERLKVHHINVYVFKNNLGPIASVLTENLNYLTIWIFQKK
jgi:hypothetical protein